MMDPDLSQRAAHVVARWRDAAAAQVREMDGRAAFQHLEAARRQWEQFTAACHTAGTYTNLPDWAKHLIEEANHE